MTTFEQAIVPGTAAGFKGLFLLSLAANGSLVSGWSTGAPQRGFLDGEARAMGAQSLIVSTLAKTASPDTCIDAGTSWVDAVVGWFQLSNGQGGIGRFPATLAVWQVPLIITAETIALTINNATEILLQAETGVFFACTQASEIVLNAASSYQGIATFTARNTGVSGNVSPGQITKIITGPAGLSIDIAETQVQTTVARDQETDREYLDRALASWGRLGAGWTLTAFNYYIPLFGNNGDDLAVTRWYVDDTNPDGPGTVHVWIANAAGPASDDEVTAVQDGLTSDDVKPLGSGALTTEKAVSHALTITATISTDGSNAQAGAQATSAIGILDAKLGIGPYELEPDLVRAILMGAGLSTATIFTPNGFDTIALDLPGFASVIDVPVLDFVATETIALGEVLEITLILTVLP